MSSRSWTKYIINISVKTRKREKGKHEIQKEGKREARNIIGNGDSILFFIKSCNNFTLSIEQQLAPCRGHNILYIKPLDQR